MNPKLCKRLKVAHGATTEMPSSTFPSSIEKTHATSLPKTSLRDQAALLLSIADIAKSEIGSSRGFTTLWDDDDDLPKFPILTPRAPSSEEERSERRAKLLARLETCSEDVLYPASRIRCVSIDSPGLQGYEAPRTASPLSLNGSSAASPTFQPEASSSIVTPMPSPGNHRRLPLRKQRQRLSTRSKREVVVHSDSDDSSCNANMSSRSPAAGKGKPLQEQSPKGVTIKKIARRKFSWKNYPELEQFLIVNREEYLRHSALNYTVQQKQYNNRLTERLLELATEHGYVFDEKEFGFVTVRDRIRCYYKSYVQSAKKRGILMGYAARKAGLLSEGDLEKGSGRSTLASEIRSA